MESSDSSPMSLNYQQLKEEEKIKEQYAEEAKAQMKEREEEQKKAYEEMKKQPQTRILILGSNYIASQIFSAICSFPNIHVTLMDRKDPLTIQNLNQVSYRIIKSSCPGITTKHCYEGQEWGNKGAERYICFSFKDWTRENIVEELEDIDIVINAGGIFDYDYADNNMGDTFFLANDGLINLIAKMGVRETGDIPKRPLFIQLSSLNVYGDQRGKPHEEEILEDITLPNPKHPLDVATLNSENIVRSTFGPEEEADYIILRLGELIGEFTPPGSLMTSAVLALLKKQKTFNIQHRHNSIDFLNMTDLAYLFATILEAYKQHAYHMKLEAEAQENPDVKVNVTDEEKQKYKDMVNQTYNIKAEEKEEKTVFSAVKSLFAMASFLPQITDKHAAEKGIKIKKNKPYRVKAPEISIDPYTVDDIYVKFDKPISSKKAFDKLGFLSSKPLVWSYTDIIRYCLTAWTDEIPEKEKDLIRMIFYIIKTPAGTETTNPELKDLIEDVNKEVSRAFNG